MKNYTPMIRQYLSIKADHSDAFLFFRLGDFYEMFFEDALEASKLLEIALTGRDGGVEEKIPMCGVPHHAAEGYISRLVELGHKVAICEQVEDPRDAKGIVRREVIRVITPGTIVEGARLENQANNYICSLSQRGTRLGLAIADLSTGEFYATELGAGASPLLSELYQYKPSEIILSADLAASYGNDLARLTSALTIVEEVDSQLAQDLIRQQFTEGQEELTSPVQLAVGNLINYIKINQQRLLTHITQLKIYDSNKYMILDPFSKRNLELVETTREQKKRGSLFWLLDQTETAMGRRELKRWLEKPLRAPEAIESRLNIVEELIGDLILKQELTDRLGQVYDLERLVAKAAYGNVTARELYNLRLSLERIASVAQEIALHSSAKELQTLFAGVDLCRATAELIAEGIVDEPPLVARDGGVIKRGYNVKLDEYYGLRGESIDWLRRLEQSEREATGIKSLKVRYNKVFGYYIEVTKSNIDQVPEDRYIRKQTLANAERYITEELKIKENAILEAEEQTLALESQLFNDLRDKVAEDSDALLGLARVVAQLDVLLSFAKLSSKNNYVRPNFNREGRIEITAGRHPVIEALNSREYFFANDALLDQADNQILIITGPNMSGKSTYMRQIALSVIMAQIGCFVPATSASLPIIDRIFTRIGAGDDLTGGHSTFMIEMMETKQALIEATPASLILLDEIGRGTSTYDGMALAQAILQYIHDHVNAKTLFSTHYHELTALEENYPKIKNIQVTVMERDNQIIFLHRIKEGKADKSYGIHVAELAGIPRPIIKDAKKILLEIEANTREYQIRLDLSDRDSNTSLTPTRGDDYDQELLIDLAQRMLALNLDELAPLAVVNLINELKAEYEATRKIVDKITDDKTNI